MSSANESLPFPGLKLLAGKRILVCRPEPGASELAQALEALGAECQKLPMLEIKAIEISASERQHIMDLDQYQHVIVVSQHAAQIGLDEIDTYWPQFPVQQKWYAIGRKTASVLNSVALDLHRPEHDLNSEEVLQHPALQEISDDKVLILKGKDGRTTLEQSLGQRAAGVDTVNLYQRERPHYEQDSMTQKLSEFDPDYIIALSGETLSNLIQHCQAHSIDLSQRSFILSSNRVANIAREQGITKCLIPDNLMPMDIVKCIKKANRSTSA